MFELLRIYLVRQDTFKKPITVSIVTTGEKKIQQCDMNGHRYLFFYPSSKHQKKNSEIVEWHDWSHRPVECASSTQWQQRFQGKTTEWY